MGHPDNGQLLALLDGELTDAQAQEVRAHMEGCLQCRHELEDLDAAAGLLDRALELLDVDPGMASARARLGEKTDGLPIPAGPELREESGPVGAARSPRRFWSLPKAASIALLLTGVTASALPGSPVRRWLTEGWRGLTGSPGRVEETLNPVGIPSDRGEDQGAPETGAGIPIQEGRVEIWIHGLTHEAGLRVLWTDSEEVWIYAGEGTRFNSADNLIEAFDPPGTVRVEIPTDLNEVILGLDGIVLLKKSRGELEIRGPVEERSPTEIRFEGRGSTNNGRGSTNDARP
ncbi:MAG: hypothetical protein HKO65_20210 [Gemmatimonadetes bacterium]|nr:zf-HC2 domain-containing protein [Gemmatimonadota bacterium]NNM07427.1 hypothetical protein [Gemmatimonadota bacterium]